MRRGIRLCGILSLSFLHMGIDDIALTTWYLAILCRNFGMDRPTFSSFLRHAMRNFLSFSPFFPSLSSSSSTLSCRKLHPPSFTSSSVVPNLDILPPLCVVDNFHSSLTCIPPLPTKPNRMQESHFAKKWFGGFRRMCAILPFYLVVVLGEAVVQVWAK